ncbi:FkbM family methyltransferase [Oceanibaculum indicum]|uniref:FkbM family methyltransferase n=2 Tax=Oceanibaculum indicum TaxID=526216 RepID=A0A420WC04_9PROT|nr:FkbM family methyltransferase [Oceanibaculum indicum]
MTANNLPVLHAGVPRRRPRKWQRMLSALARELRVMTLRFRRPEVAETHGVKLWLAAPVLRKGHRRQIVRHDYEEAELSILDATLTPEDSVLELGAGIGLTSIFCARRIGNGAKVHALEANPALVPVLERNFALNGVRPDFHNMAAAKETGEVEFALDRSYTSSGIHGRPSETVERVRLPAAGFQDLLDRYRPSYLIMDIEGGEIDLLPGADLTCVQKICLEVHPEIVGDAAISGVVRGLMETGFLLHFSRNRKNVIYMERSPAAAGARPIKQPGTRGA